MRILHTIVSVVLILPSLLYGQSRVHFTSLNQSNGLVSGDVMCFRQDENGFMWIGTKYGLNIYDGENFSVYGNSPETPFTSDISCLCNGEGNDMWIGTYGDGLFLFHSVSHTCEQIILVSGRDTIRNINCITAVNHSIWVGTSSGLFEVTPDGEPNYIITDPEPISISTIEALGTNLALGTNQNGVLVIDKMGKTLNTYFSGKQINALLNIGDSLLLAGSQSSGLLYLLIGKETKEGRCRLAPLDQSPIINDLIRDKEGDIWIGTDGLGLIRIGRKGNSFALKDRFVYDGKAKNSIPSNAVFSVYEDNRGNKWIGTIWKGMAVMNHARGNTEFYYSDLSGDDPYPVLSVYREQDELWLGTDGNGLEIIDMINKKTRRISSVTSPALKGDYIQTISRDSKGLFWFGTFSSGLFSYDRINGTIREYSQSGPGTHPISYNDIRAVLEDKKTNLWVATWGGGLNYFDRATGTFTTYRDCLNKGPKGSADNITSACFNQDSSGLWIGTFDNGIFRFDFKSGDFVRTGENNLDKLKVLTVYLDKTRRLWIGTWGTGLKVYNTVNGQEEKTAELEQLSALRVTAIEEDDNGAIWFSSKNGIYRYEPDAASLQKFGGFDLVSNKEFHINSSFKDKEGIIYFGGIEGILAIHPDDNYRMDNVLSPAITEFQLYNEKAPADLNERILTGKSLNLRYDQNYITLTFSTPWFPVSDITYRYMLENLDEQWINTNSGIATFTNLSPGEYTFRVQATQNKAEWSEEARLSIRISQPYWKRWWAYLIYVSLFTILLFLFQKYTRDWENMKANLRMETFEREKENELHHVKQRFFTNISHEIRTPVSLILSAVNRLEESGILNRGYRKELGAIQTSSRHLLQLINELLDFRKLESDGIKIKVAEGDFNKFSKEIYLSFQAQAAIKSIDYQYISRSEKAPLWYDRIQMEKVLYNLISNAFKYTPKGGTIKIELDQDDQFCYLKVSDSGKGIPEEHLFEIFKRFYQSENAEEIRESGFGLGLSISKEIVTLHGGEIGASNNKEAGICISVKLPKGISQFPVEQQNRDFRNSEFIENYLAGDPGDNGVTDFGSFGNISLLIVEDNDYLRDFLTTLFPPNFSILTASNGKEGLSIAVEHIPDLIISDVMMPEMDGVAMTKSLKTSIQTSHIPVVLLTARTNLVYKKEGFDIGADDYITKPFNQSLLKSRVYNILKSRRQLSEKVLREYITRPREELNISTPDQQFLSRLTLVIEENIHENELSARLLASELGMSHSVIYKKIKALTGLSLVEFIRDFKLKRAAVLLSKYEMNISDVCYNVGFSDRRYFSKLFKQKFGVPPSEYAKNHGDLAE